MTAAPQARRPVFTQISWWAKFGQPLEAPPEVQPAPGAEPEALHDEGYGFGYVYGPGSCDCNPPCTDQLWAGYMQTPRRCGYPQYNYRGHCGSGSCGACGHVSDCGCTAAPAHCGCATPVGNAAPAAHPATRGLAPMPAADEASILKKPLLRRVSTTGPTVR